MVIVVAIVLTIVTAGAFAAAGGVFVTSTGALSAAGLAATGATVGFVTGGLGAALNGGSLGDILRGAAIGAIQGAITGGVLHGMESSGFNLATLQHIVGHGIVGGVANVAMGGKFQDGFLSAAASAGLADLGVYGAFKGPSPGAVAGRTALAGLVGGTASVLGGGKFANGAYTAAFQHLLNAEIAQKIRVAGYSNGPSDPTSDYNSFKSRAEMGAGKNIFGFNTPDMLIDALKGFKNIFNLDLHGHGNVLAFFTGNVDGRIYPKDFNTIAQLIGSGKISMAQGANIRLFACNQSGHAINFSVYLASAGRSDITVYGANGSVSPTRSGNSAFVIDGGERFIGYRDGNIVGTSKTQSYSNP